MTTPRQPLSAFDRAIIAQAVAHLEGAERRRVAQRVRMRLWRAKNRAVDRERGRRAMRAWRERQRAQADCPPTEPEAGG